MNDLALHEAILAAGADPVEWGMLCAHWIPIHRGPEDREYFGRLRGRHIKIVTIDETIPYIEDVPAGTIIIVRNHPMSELYGERGFRDLAPDDRPYEVRAEEYWQEWGRKVEAARKADPGNPLARPPRQIPLAQPTGNSPFLERDDPVGYARQRGIEHADACRRMANYANARGIPDSQMVFEGLNEPHLWDDEPPELTAAYYLAFLQRLHFHGLRGCVLNAGVGWPGNGGVPDAPPIWDFFAPVIAIFLPGDLLGLHEYWSLQGPQQNWLWWAGRYIQCPFNVPIALTETGIDCGVEGQGLAYGAWMDLPGTFEEKAARYVGELVWTAMQGKTDGRVVALCIFTHDMASQHWQKFNTRVQAFINAILAVARIAPPPGRKVGPVTPPPVEPPPPEPPPDPPPATTVKWTATVSLRPQEALNHFDGHVTLDGKPLNGAMVVFSWQPDGEWATKEARTGDKGWATGYFDHIIKSPGTAPGRWYTWLVDPLGKRYTPLVELVFDGPGGNNEATVDFKGVTQVVTPPATDPVLVQLKAEFGAQFSDLRAALPKHPSLTYAKRSTVNRIIVHHTASALTTTWEAVARYHVSRDWPGIGYHVGIAPDGKVSYLGAWDTLRYHAGDANTDSIGVCCIGNYEAGDAPTAAMLDALKRVTQALNRATGKALAVVGHKDVSAGTVCPGKALYPYVSGLNQPAGNVGAAMLAEAERRQVIFLNPGAALQKCIFADGFMPTSGEFSLTIDGELYIGQRAERLSDGAVRCYYCISGNWENVRYIARG